MAKHYHTDAHELLKGIRAFLSTCRSPALLEYGDDLFPLTGDSYALEVRSERLWVDAWHESRSISRRILSIEKHRTGLLDCLVHRFGGSPGKLTFLDTERPQTAHRKLSGERGSFAERFRRMLARQFPGWQIEALSCSMDLRRSFSPTFPRARLSRGSHQIAAIACPSTDMEPALLTFALIWFDYVRTRSASTRLCLFLPEAAGSLTAHRLRWLDNEALRPTLFRFNDHGSAGEVDPQDLGNIDTRVSQQFEAFYPSPSVAALERELRQIDGIGFCPELNGDLSVRCRGVEFARLRGDRAFVGLEDVQEVGAADFQSVIAFANHLREIGTAPALPERWLESAVRAEPERIHPLLNRVLLHSQVLTFAGTDRDIVDLLGITAEGQLAVLELKADEDIHLPIQALDYWIRVRWHAERGELNHLFPGIGICGLDPLLLLVGPALTFHPAVQTVLRYFSPVINVERIGVNSSWQHGLKVVMRLAGAAAPRSHEHHHRSSEYQESHHQSKS